MNFRCPVAKGEAGGRPAGAPHQFPRRGMLPGAPSSAPSPPSPCRRRRRLLGRGGLCREGVIAHGPDAPGTRDARSSWTRQVWGPGLGSHLRVATFWASAHLSQPLLRASDPTRTPSGERGWGRGPPSLGASRPLPVQCVPSRDWRCYVIVQVSAREFPAAAVTDRHRPGESQPPVSVVA